MHDLTVQVDDAALPATHRQKVPGGGATAALEMAGRLGLAASLEVAAALAFADRVGAMLTRLVRRLGG